MAINKENLDKLITHLENIPPKAFDMGKWVAGPLSVRGFMITGDQKKAKSVVAKQLESTEHTCNTAGCIAGYASILWVAENGNNKHAQHDVSEIAEEWLGLSPETAYALFQPRLVEYKDVTVEIAVKVLKNLRDTGRVAWRKFGVGRRG